MKERLGESPSQLAWGHFGPDIRVPRSLVVGWTEVGMVGPLHAFGVAVSTEMPTGFSQELVSFGTPRSMVTLRMEPFPARPPQARSAPSSAASVRDSPCSAGVPQSW